MSSVEGRAATDSKSGGATAAAPATAAAEAPAAATAAPTSSAEVTYNCVKCNKPIFKASDLVKTSALWGTAEYKATTHFIRSLIDEKSFRRYDVSLHLGWYCCSFICMRMTHDKFGTGDSLLVYADSVVKSTDVNPSKVKPHTGQTRLGQKDYNSVINSEAMKDKLLWVKYSGSWCPPCRQLEAVILKLEAANTLGSDVAFFEVDVDTEHQLAAEWNNDGIPFSVFYWNGKQIKVEASFQTRDMVVDGGVCGCMSSAEVVSLATRLVTASKAGKSSIPLAA